MNKSSYIYIFISIYIYYINLNSWKGWLDIAIISREMQMPLEELGKINMLKLHHPTETKKNVKQKVRMGILTYLNLKDPKVGKHEKT